MDSASSLKELLLQEQEKALAEQDKQLEELDKEISGNLKATVLTIGSEIDEQNRMLEELGVNVAAANNILTNQTNKTEKVYKKSRVFKLQCIACVLALALIILLLNKV